MINQKQLILTTGIAILLTIFFAYGTFILNPGPDYGECYEREKFFPTEELNETLLQEQRKCAEKLDIEREASQFNSVVMLSILGVLSIIIGSFVSKNSDSVGNGIFSGGILTIIYGTLTNWGSLNQYLRLFLIGLALALLIYFGYKKIDSR